jgi:hypothetical protein
MKTTDIAPAALSTFRAVTALRNLPLAAAVAVLGFTSLTNAAIVMNGNFEILDTGPTDALGWTGENGTTIIRAAASGVSGSAGVLISNTTPVSAAGPLTQNTGFAGGATVSVVLIYTNRFDSQRTMVIG